MRDVINHDVRVLPREFQDNSQADAAIATGNNGDFIFKIHDVFSG